MAADRQAGWEEPWLRNHTGLACSLPLSSCVALGRLFHFSGQLLSRQSGMMINLLCGVTGRSDETKLAFTGKCSFPFPPTVGNSSQIPPALPTTSSQPALSLSLPRPGFPHDTCLSCQTLSHSGDGQEPSCLFLRGLGTAPLGIPGVPNPSLSLRPVPLPSQFPGPLNTREPIQHFSLGCVMGQVARATAHLFWDGSVSLSKGSSQALRSER